MIKTSEKWVNDTLAESANMMIAEYFTCMLAQDLAENVGVRKSRKAKMTPSKSNYKPYSHNQLESNTINMCFSKPVKKTKFGEIESAVVREEVVVEEEEKQPEAEELKSDDEDAP